MRWTVFRVTCTCGWRRTAGLLVANPLLAVLAALGSAASPALGVWAGARLASSFADAAAQPSFLRLLAIGVGVSGAVGGASVALLAPGPGALGPQVAAAPRSRATLAIGTVIGPVCAASAALAVLLACFAVPLAGSIGVALVLLAVACAALGAALGEGVRLIVAREWPGAGVVAAAALVWTSVGLAGDAGPAVGPGAVVERSWAPAPLAVTGAAGLALWLVACGIARRERSSARDVLLPRIPARAGPAVAVATARRILRHPELRLLGATAVVLPIAAAVAARLALGLSGAPATVFCVAITLTAAALYPPAAMGLARAARWLLAASPRRRPYVAAGAATGGVAAAAALVGAAAVLSTALGVPDASVYLELEGATAFVLGCAALAGGLVPWHPDRVLIQLASYAAVLASVVAGWLLVGRFEALAADGAGFALVAGNTMLVVGVGAAAAVAR